MATKRLFSDWDKEELEMTFGLTRLYRSSLIDQWFEIAATHTRNAVEQEILTNLRQALFENSDAWNEAELAKYFIGPLLAFVNFNTTEFKIFSERSIAGIVGDYELYGESDAVIAKGHYSPQVPYFCLHEYKKANEPKGDPAAQALVAMLVAREASQRRHPIYGVYVVGEFWHFMVLQNDEYCISKSFAADDEEIFDIFSILKALKAILIEIARREAVNTPSGV